MARSGRPRNTDDIDLVTLDECLLRCQEFLRLQKPPFVRRTLQNKLSRGEFQRYGTYKEPQVDWNEVKRTLHWRKTAS
jgi:hypothetical protein